MYKTLSGSQRGAPHSSTAGIYPILQKQSLTDGARRCAPWSWDVNEGGQPLAVETGSEREVGLRYKTFLHAKEHGLRW